MTKDFQNKIITLSFSDLALQSFQLYTTWTKVTLFAKKDTYTVIYDLHVQARINVFFGRIVMLCLTLTDNTTPLSNALFHQDDPLSSRLAKKDDGF